MQSFDFEQNFFSDESDVSDMSQGKSQPALTVVIKQSGVCGKKASP